MAQNTIDSPPPQRLVLRWKTRILLSILSTFNDASLRRDGTIDRRGYRLVSSLGVRAPPDHKSIKGVSTSDVIVDPSRNLWYRLFVPTTATDTELPVVVFFHGGGFVHLAPDFKYYDNVCRCFAHEVQAVVVSVNYRLAPEHRYPAQYEDGFDVLTFLDKNNGPPFLPQNADLSRCFIAGDSAGGNLAHHVAKRVCECKSKFTHIKVIGLVVIQPFFGGEERTKAEIELAGIDPISAVKRTDWMWNAFMPPGAGMNRDHEVINVSGPKAADISKLDFPATMVVVAGFDSLKDWQTKYYEWLKKSGKEVYLVEYPTMFHAFYMFPEVPESAQLVSDVKQFIHNQCSKSINQL